MSGSSPHSSQQLRSYAQATYSWEAGQKTEDELLQRIWNLADDVGRLVEQLESCRVALTLIRDRDVYELGYTAFVQHTAFEALGASSPAKRPT